MSDEQLHEEGPEAPPRGVRAMAIVRWLLVIAAAAAAAYSILHVSGVIGGPRAEAGTWYCPMHPHVVQDHPGECPICHMSLVKRGDDEGAKAMLEVEPQGDGAYYCPMHPQVTSDDPEAICDLCGGMKLVPVPETSEGAGTGLVPIELSADRVQHMGLRTEPVAKRTLSASQRALATVGASETGWSQATPRFAGWLEHVYVTETGARVKRGQALATLYSPELVAAQEEYLATLGWASGPALPSLPGARHDTTPAPTLADDARRRLELFGMSKADIATITRTGKPMRTVTIRAATGGNVLSRSAVTGAYVQPGAILFEIADLSTVWAWIEVPERDLGRIAIGQPASLEVTAFPGERFSGKVGFLAPTVDATTRTLRARIELPNPDGRLRPGMSGQASIELPEIDAVTIPDLALIDTGEAQYVFVATGEGRFEPRRVEVGRRIEGWVELLPGRVAEGEQVVTTGNFLLDAESRLQAQIQGSSTSGTPTAPTGHEGH